MSMVQGTIAADRPRISRRWRGAAVAAAVAASLVVGFQTGKALDPAPRVVRTVTPAYVLDVGYPGPGHVPRRWVDQP
jgi:hypothetical protein